MLKVTLTGKMSFLQLPKYTVQQVDRRRAGPSCGRGLLVHDCSGNSGPIPPLQLHLPVLFTKPLGCVEFRVSLSWNFSSLHSPQGAHYRHKAARFPRPWHTVYKTVGEDSLGLVGPKGLLTTPPNIVISYLSHNFISSQWADWLHHLHTLQN